MGLRTENRCRVGPSCGVRPLRLVQAVEVRVRTGLELEPGSFSCSEPVSKTQTSRNASKASPEKTRKSVALEHIVAEIGSRQQEGVGDQCNSWSTGKCCGQHYAPQLHESQGCFPHLPAALLHCCVIVAETKNLESCSNGAAGEVMTRKLKGPNAYSR